MRGNIAHASTPQLEMHLFRILLLTDQMNLSQYNSQITNGAEGDTGKCTAARGALEEALSILRVHLQDGMAAQILTDTVTHHTHLRVSPDRGS